jgi:hypothetical protein
MEESYEKGVANHLDPELCGAGRKAGHEALVGARAGQPLSPESTQVWGADAVPLGGRPHSAPRQRKRDGDPTGSETLRMHGNTSHENREIPDLLRHLRGRASERSGKAEAARR